MATTQIAIDGPAGAGKSTIAKLVAELFKYTYIDTGAMYRAITLKAMRLNVELNDEDAFDFLNQTSFDYENGVLFMDSVDVSRLIRSREVSNNVSLVSSHQRVREILVERQRAIAHHKNVVMDGRDIGYNVLPNADFKFFLTANVATRAKRRFLENAQNGIHIPLEDLKNEIIARDDFDSNRTITPLKPAEDAIVIDTSDMKIEDVVKTIESIVRGENNHENESSARR